MPSAKHALDNQFLQMRSRILSLAADFDRLGRLPEGNAVLEGDPRIVTLRRALELLLKNDPNRAEQLQLIFSDLTPPPRPDPK